MSFVEKYWNQKSILEDMNTVHLSNLSFMSKALCCEFCGKILKLTINLERHMKTVHLANLSFISKALFCEFWGKILKLTIHLGRHMTGAYLGTPTHGFKFSLTLAIEPMDPILYGIISKIHGFNYSLSKKSTGSRNPLNPF